MKKSLAIATGLICFVGLGHSCSDHSSGVSVAEGSVTSNIGPAGGTIKGPAGTRLQGVIIEIPAGALSTLVTLELRSSEDLKFPAAKAVGPAIAIQATPDPGRLLKPFKIRCPVNVTRFTSAQDIVVLREIRRLDLAGKSKASGIAALQSTVGLSGNRAFFSAEGLRFGTHQPQLLGRKRNVEDAASLVAQALSELDRRSMKGLDQAGFLFRQALVADPFNVEAAFLSATTRLLELLVDSSDLTTGIDSLGELLDRMGFQTGRKTLLNRLIDNDWKLRFVQPPQALRQSEVLGYLDGILLPGLAAVRNELLSVADHFNARIELDFGFGANSERELDYTDLVALRAIVDALSFAFEFMASFDWDIDLDIFAKRIEVEDILKRFKDLGSKRADRMPAAASFLHDTLQNLIETQESLQNETDDQRDDVLVFDPALDQERKDASLENMTAMLRSLRTASKERIRILRQPGRVVYALRDFFLNGDFSPRALLPEFAGSVLVANNLKDPSLAGLFPLMDKDEAIARASLATRAELPRAEIVLDGKTGDWPGNSEVLQPRDFRGDAKGFGEIPAVDGIAFFAAKSKGMLFFRVDFSDDSPRHRSRYATLYSIRIKDLRAGAAGATSFRIVLDTSAPLVAAWLVPPGALVGPTGIAIPIPFALGDKSFELGLPLNKLSGGKAQRERLVEFSLAALDRDNGRQASDKFRPVILKF